jgi:hypothetical protein
LLFARLAASQEPGTAWKPFRRIRTSVPTLGPGKASARSRTCLGTKALQRTESRRLDSFDNASHIFMPRPFYDREEPIPKSKHTGLWQNPECVPKLENV